MLRPGPIQSTDCQKADWTKHRSNCSALPAGELKPARPSASVASESEIKQIEGLVLSCAKSWNASAYIIEV